MTEPDYKDRGGFGHDEVRCDEQADLDTEFLLVGSPRTCCVCNGHDCAEALAERAKHPPPGTNLSALATRPL